jgi:hypothetical protein
LAEGTTAPLLSMTVPVTLPPTAAQRFNAAENNMARKKTFRFALGAAKDGSNRATCTSIRGEEAQKLKVV